MFDRDYNQIPLSFLLTFLVRNLYGNFVIVVLGPRFLFLVLLEFILKLE